MSYTKRYVTSSIKRHVQPIRRKLESHERQQSPQLPSVVNTRGYIKQVTIQNIFSLFSWDRLQLCLHISLTLLSARSLNRGALGDGLVGLCLILPCMYPVYSVLLGLTCGTCDAQQCTAWALLGCTACIIIYIIIIHWYKLSRDNMSRCVLSLHIPTLTHSHTGWLTASSPVTNHQHQSTHLWYTVLDMFPSYR